MKKYNDLEKNLRDEQYKEMNLIIENFHSNYPSNPKPSGELLNHERIFENLKKMRE